LAVLDSLNLIGNTVVHVKLMNRDTQGHHVDQSML